MPGRLNPTRKTSFGESVEDVVDRLSGHCTKGTLNGSTHGFSTGVWMGAQRFEYGNPRRGDAKADRTQ